ncbi:RNA polymerase sigma factor [Nocardia otitidiscaviarum]|uniref:RNA polymerase sigma factor n=1 Tax=Nocardia otitidiscaviarum TaxID=1823 RepID=UPI001892E647|nr:sigma-70 family RNA polymerase sigma factor [Nocardia otitidiscaviarum]MBF6183387.1 sigma-70 family RNA polymerase sigma factor [Nocardia otitidiscaviarum]
MTEEHDQINLRTSQAPDLRRDLELLHHERFSGFYRANIANLVGFLVTQGARLADATDIAQDTMIKLWQSWSRIESPLAWARIVAGRELVRRYSAIEDDHINETEYSALLGYATNVDDWVQSAAYQEALTTLPPRQRQVLVWTMQGYSTAEIAGELRITAATVRSNLRKARRAVALYLAKGAQQ